MFLKIKRIKKEKDFKKIFQKGKGQYGRQVGLKYLKNELGTNRFAVIVSNKISKKASERNRIKRQIKNILKEQEYQKKTNYDIIIIVLSFFNKKERKEIEEEITYLLNKHKLLK